MYYCDSRYYDQKITITTFKVLVKRFKRIKIYEHVEWRVSSIHWIDKVGKQKKWIAEWNVILSKRQKETMCGDDINSSASEEQDIQE